MDSSEQIIADLKEKVEFGQPLDFLCAWKGVPVVIQGYIQEVRDDQITFRMEPVDSICLYEKEHALLLHDIFISGIQGRILNFDIKSGLLTLDSFTYIDHGFGGRAMVRVETEDPIDAHLLTGTVSIPCKVMDISLSGFGILIATDAGQALTKGTSITLRTNLRGEMIETPGEIRGIFRQGEAIRLAIVFKQGTPGHATVTRYIRNRRAEIRQEIQEAYRQATA